MCKHSTFFFENALILYTLTLHAYKTEEKYGINIVKQVVEPVNTTRTGRASISAKRVLLDPEEYLQALDLRNFSFRIIFLHLFDTIIHARHFDMYKSGEKYGRNIVKQVVEPVNTTRTGRALFERSEFCSTLRSIYRL